MTDPIHVQPAPGARVAFARWAVAQTPKVPTAGPNMFAVPAALFADVPEETLIGSTVDGHRYISPDDDHAESGEEAPAGEELTGVATADGFLTAVPGEPLPEVPADAYPADSVPLPPPDQPAADEPTQEPSEDEPMCAVCGRPFKSERGLQTHMRRAHDE